MLRLVQIAVALSMVLALRPGYTQFIDTMHSISATLDALNGEAN